MKQIRILLADDHNIVRKGLRLLLESQPQFAVVAEAADGRQAVEQAEATNPDVVVLDIAMPNLSGIEAAQRITSQRPETSIVFLSMHSDEGYVLRALKADTRTRAIPVIVMSSSHQEHDVLESCRLGISGYVTKPVQFSSFAEVVTKAGLERLIVEREPAR